MVLLQPTKKHIHFHRTEGQYNLLSSDSQVQFRFVFPELNLMELKELGLEDTFYLDPNKEYFNCEGYTALDVAYELGEVYEGYFLHTGKDKIKKLKSYLESIEDQQDELRYQYEIEYAEHKVRYWEDKVADLKRL